MVDKIKIEDTGEPDPSSNANPNENLISSNANPNENLIITPLGQEVLNAIHLMIGDNLIKTEPPDEDNNENNNDEDPLPE
jgi:hypothetical protein